ncbi:hypothetical protein DPMN_086737 [Dreissena polymorpha]|uniref:Uncharacterized protein n=1 Tax=Dreissena polymorpha TaxID=45954 RepID=A0A9D4KRQ9_DREPO|nr:hypothetical protein DPMN_086737 [Dreissena polymorpha]
MANISFGTNILTEFHEELPIKIHEDNKVKSRVLTMKLPLSLRSNVLTNLTSRVQYREHKCHGHVFPQTKTIFQLGPDIIRKNGSTKKHAPPSAYGINEPYRLPNPGGHVFQRTATRTNLLTNFKLIQAIIGTNFLIKLHEDGQ